MLTSIERRAIDLYNCNQAILRTVKLKMFTPNMINNSKYTLVQKRITHVGYSTYQIIKLFISKMYTYIQIQLQINAP